MMRSGEPRGGEQADGRLGPAQGLWGGAALTSAWQSTELVGRPSPKKQLCSPPPAPRPDHMTQPLSPRFPHLRAR